MHQDSEHHSIAPTILQSYAILSSDQNHRYRSWEHCFEHFKKRKSIRTKDEKHLAALHLGFYLASWGMYRGSSALLWKDYLTHEPVVSKLLNQKYDNLWNLNLGNPSNDSKTIGLIISLSEDIKSAYAQEFKTVNGKQKSQQPSEVLITKVLLGTIGCTPAYDRFFKDGFCHKEKTSKAPKLTSTFLHQVFGFYRKHEQEFISAQEAIKNKSGFYYPPMKLVDMYFWKVGFDLNPERKKP